MNDRRALVFDVNHRHGCDEQERRRHECYGDRRRANDPSRQEAEPHRELGGERAGHRLREREALPVLIVVEPASLLDQVAVHVADKRDRSAEAVGPEAQEVGDEAVQGSRVCMHLVRVGLHAGQYCQ
jgi:hypothetical protein